MVLTSSSWHACFNMLKGYFDSTNKYCNMAIYHSNGALLCKVSSCDIEYCYNYIAVNGYDFTCELLTDDIKAIKFQQNKLQIITDTVYYEFTKCNY